MRKSLVVLLASFLAFNASLVRVHADQQTFTLAVPPDNPPADTTRSTSESPSPPMKVEIIKPVPQAVGEKGGVKADKTPGPVPRGMNVKTEPVDQDEIPGVPATSREDASSQVAIPEITQRAIMSQYDVNRIVCPGPIKDIFFSEEKGMKKPEYNGNSAIIKFQFKEVGGKVEYPSIPMDITVFCGNTVYTLIVKPKAVVSQTIRLESGKKERAKENLTRFKDQPERVKAKALIDLVYHDNIPASFTVVNQDRPIVVYKDLQTTLHRTITVEGEGLVLKEYYVVPSVDGLELNEKSFIRREFDANPFAMGFSELKPGKGEVSRLFIVEIASLAHGAAEGGDSGHY